MKILIYNLDGLFTKKNNNKAIGWVILEYSVHYCIVVYLLTHDICGFILELRWLKSCSFSVGSWDEFITFFEITMPFISLPQSIGTKMYHECFILR